MTRVFVDTGYWIALLNPRDKLHGRAKEVSEKLTGTGVVTSDWILTELLNSFAERGPHLRAAAASAVTALKMNESVIVAPYTGEFFTEALKLYRERADKSWSLTDCSSFLLMRQFGIDAALTYDRHFEQAGFAALLR
ncbi:MAG: PIN domain-containing protein [Terracidiphilus sp.]